MGSREPGGSASLDLEALLRPPCTADPDRRRLYPDDIHFREMADRIGRLDPAARDRLLSDVSFVMFKPEAVAGRRIRTALDFLADQGFEVLGALPVQLDARAHRELWRYQLNAAPLAIIRTVDLILESGPSVFVGMVDRRRGSGSAESGSVGEDVTAARRLGDLKGSSRDRKNYGRSLRGVLDSTLLCLNFVHAPDEPADMIREVGVLFPGRRAREQALALLTGPSVAQGRLELDALLEKLHAEQPAHPLDAELALREADPALRALIAGGDVTAALDALEEDWAGLAPWDRITLAALVVDGLDSDHLPLIGPPPGERAEFRKAWVAGRVG